MGYGWCKNSMFEFSQILYDNNQDVEYIYSIFDRVYDYNVYILLFSIKEKFVLFQQSYVKVDQSVFDEFVLLKLMIEVIDKIISVLLDDWVQIFILVYLVEIDVQGYLYGWSVEEGLFYLKLFHNIDDVMGVLLDYIENSVYLNGSIFVVLILDYGGGEFLYYYKVVILLDNFIIFLFIWIGKGGESCDLYELNVEMCC